MIKREITSNLMKKSETFKILALGEAMGAPVLLIGPPGVAKTAAVIDFAKAASGGTMNHDDLFILETDEGTRSNEIKGTIDLEELTLNQKYKKVSPITTAKYVVINEVDKASATLRNSMLGVMNEKILFDGKDKIPCQWKSFIATCNSIPDDEKDSPFWDRFMVTFNVERLRQSDILNYYEKGGKEYSRNQKINLPEEEDINAITLNPDKLKKIIDLVYDKLSDRSLSFLPLLIKNIMVVWNYGEDRGMIKAVELLVGKNEAKDLANNLVSKEMKEIYNQIDMIGSCISASAYETQFDKVADMCEELQNKGKLTKEDLSEIRSRIDDEEAKLAFINHEEEAIEELAEIL